MGLSKIQWDILALRSTDALNYPYIDPGTGMVVTTAAGWIVAALSGFFGVVFLFFRRAGSFFGRNWKGVLILLLLVALAVVFLTRSTKEEERQALSFEKRVFILGLDGMSPDLMEPLLAAGRLPNLAKLREQGSYSRLATTNPPQSPVAWSAFATGLNPGKNGVYDFIVREPSDYSIRLSLSDLRDGKPKPVIRAKRFWQYTSERGVDSIILGCPMTFPPDKVQGKMLSGMGVPDLLGTEGMFSFYTDEPVSNDQAGGATTTGGNVYTVGSHATKVLELRGPKVASVAGQVEPVKLPFKVVVDSARERATVRIQDSDITLAEGEWSEWQPVSFKAGLLKKVHGMVRFYLSELDPHFKLYVSPIHLDPQKPHFPISYPKGYAAEIADTIGAFHTLGTPFDTWAVNEERLKEKEFLEQARTILKERRAHMAHELEQFKQGIFLFYYESPDIIQHMFWRSIDQDHPLHTAEAAQYKNVISDWYVEMDQIVGSVVSELRQGDTLLVLSDHGMTTFRRSVHVNSWLKEQGYLFLREGKSSGAELLADVDWSRTKAYSVGFGAVYLNQYGREAEGIVRPGVESEELKRELAQKLVGFKDDLHGTAVVKAVYPTEQIFWGPYASEAPDLSIGFMSGYRASWQTAIGGAPDALIEDNTKKWSGDHLMDPSLVPGILFSNRPIRKADPSLYDIAPTVLDIVGFSDEEIRAIQFDGDTLF